MDTGKVNQIGSGNGNSTALAHTWQEAATISVSGSKVVDFLQGYLTNDLTQLSVGSLSATALCNLKGRVIANGWVYLDTADQSGPPDEDAAVVGRIIVHASLGSRIQEFLAPYAQFSRCQLHLEQSPVYMTQTTGPLHVMGDWYAVPMSAYEAHAELNTADASAELERVLVHEHFAWISAPCADKFLPQMLDLARHGAIDFDKGCYLGQEVVARAQFRGAVKRTLRKMEWHDQPPEIGLKNDQFGSVVACSTTVTHPPQGEVLGVA